MIRSLTDIAGVASYLQRVNAQPRSLQSAAVRIQEGKYWTDRATIRFGLDGTIRASDDTVSPTAEEQEAIFKGFAAAEIPEYRTVAEIPKTGIGELTTRLLLAQKEDRLFTFRGTEGEVLMLQERVEEKEGNKVYLPWTFWSDGKWRLCESGQKVPLYGLEELTQFGVVWVHEGAKAARECQRIRNDPERMAEHPWGKDLENVGHLGWCSGAPSPNRTDWTPIKNIQQVYLIADNDALGKDAVPKISQQLRGVTFYAQFTQEFPPSFDMGDPFPDDRFLTGSDGEKYFQGPYFHEILHPATWATDQLETPRGKTFYQLRPSFREQWAWVKDTNLFVCKTMPWIICTDKILNRLIRPFSGISNVADLLSQTMRDRTFSLAYRPDQDRLLITNKGVSAINVHIRCRIEPLFGESVEMWHEFLEYLIPRQEERHEVMKWIATLLAKTDVRMGYGLLMVSETQGVGKSMLGAGVLAPLVGLNNTSFPREADIMSEFNSWMSHKRLAVIHEVYSGHSKKAYTMLKSAITDQDVTVNQKYITQYTIENWCHIYAASNSVKALRMDDEDRRWFYPLLTEERWPAEKFHRLIHWLRTNGLGAILAWAMEFEDYIEPSAHAPMTERKKVIMEENQSESVQEVRRLAQCLADLEEPAALSSRDIMRWIRQSVNTPYMESFRTLKIAMMKEREDLTEWVVRLKLEGQLQVILYNEKMVKKLADDWVKKDTLSVNRKRASKMLKETRKMPEEITPSMF